MKKGAIAALVLLLAGAGGAAGWYYYNDGSFFPAEENTNTVYVTLVSTIISRISGAENRFAGVVEAQETMTVQKDSDRKVSELKVKVGDEVKKGDVLFEYDLSSIEDKLAEARLELERLQTEATSLQNQITTNHAERQKKENADKQLEMMIEIQQEEINLKKNEYDQKAKEAEIARLEKATVNTLVTSEIDGIIQKVDTSKLSTSDDNASITDDVEEQSTFITDSGDNAFITILSTGEYRVKGTVNELNRDEIIPGEGAVIRSRADETQTWRGIMGQVDSKNSKESSSGSDYYSDSGDSMTSSSSYPFYVELEDSEGLMLGQHVYIEKDVGQEDQKAGLWIPADFIDWGDTDEPFVWAADENSKLIKKSVTLGEYDEYELKYEILDGITEEDYLAFPSSGLEEGMPVKPGTLDQTTSSYSEEDFYEDEYYDDEYYDGSDEEFDYEDSYDGYYDGEFADPDIDSYVEVFDDTVDWDEENYDWAMENGEEPIVIEDDTMVIDGDDEFWDDVEVIEDLPEDMVVQSEETDENISKK